MPDMTMKQFATFLLLLVCASASPAYAADAAPRQVAPPPAEIVRDFKLAPFYQKCLLNEGFPIVASGKVDDRALLEADFLMTKMLAHKPEIRKGLIQSRTRFTIMAISEMTTDVPEHSDLKPAKYWNRRARGLGATKQRPSVSCGEENLLCLHGDPYGTENILIHEFGHAIHEMGLKVIDPTFDRRLDEAYKAAMAAGLWKGKYASVNRMEYWAEGVQSWFDTNRENDHDHNHVNTRAEIKEYDAGLSKLLEEIFGDGAWRYQRPEKRSDADKLHFKGFDRDKAPRFAWPKDVAGWTDKALADVKEQHANLGRIELHALKPGETAPKSKAGGKTSTLVIANSGKQTIKVAWVDEQGRLHEQGTVRPGFVTLRTTWGGHVFSFTGEDGKPLGYAIAGDSDGRVLVGE